MRLTHVLHTESVTIIKAAPTGDTDADGVPITDAPTQTAWSGLAIQQTTADETTAGDVDEVATTYSLSGPIPSVELTAADTIRWNGIDYSIVGDPDTRRGRHRINHTSLVLRRARG
ncbi:hypothetical protein RN607_00690 [Demequina capsici]|uniref:Head-tail adaptor protein n=1 Tax=Demequina capsici TaxID=3075620 RepID=A0AA96FDN7_9MICO|nr:hypothetical protein [Demequina sp. PMTSA13]WNM27550.1 hypothetical protein RN607_00690 [Demequina sp. PMTSA13]